jgi:hypothetical protein
MDTWLLPNASVFVAMETSRGWRAIDAVAA